MPSTHGFFNGRCRRVPHHVDDPLLGAKTARWVLLCRLGYGLLKLTQMWTLLAFPLLSGGTGLLDGNVECSLSVTGALCAVAALNQTLEHY